MQHSNLPRERDERERSEHLDLHFWIRRIRFSPDHYLDQSLVQSTKDMPAEQYQKAAINAIKWDRRRYTSTKKALPAQRT